jgi:hypothetical protein
MVSRAHPSSNPNDALRQKNCGLDVTPSTDLNPRPKRPISTPLFGEVGQQEGFHPGFRDGCSLVCAIQVGLGENHLDPTARDGDLLICAVLNQFKNLTSPIAAEGEVLLLARVLVDEKGLGLIDRQVPLRHLLDDGPQGRSCRRGPSAEVWRWLH